MIIAIATNNTGHNTEIPGRAQNAAYCQYVANAGYDPILVPMEADPNRIAEISDGLLLAGGVDIDPIHYGLSNYASFSVDPERDESERALFHAFREAHKPIFGICRGFQLIFRELLHTHEDKDEYEIYFEYLENISDHSQTTGLSVPRRFPSHQIKANVSKLFGVPERLLADRDPITVIPVNSMHHQAVTCNFGAATKDLMPELLVGNHVNRKEPVMLEINDVELLGWSMRGVRQPVITKGQNKVPDYDNYWTVVEAAQIHNWGGPIMGVQWHPEELNDTRIIKAFFGPHEEALAGNV